ncbi:hypothetical protein [Lactobacillus johnsonii]|uniref:hypothetical protein n=1 Tax=Lactobacillus johnsonii TaxID=33959 RepID=UPI001E421BB8|nr:hypothetical protein [Lactobacillus johnsonii]
MLKGRITDIIQKYDIDAGVIVKYGDQIMYQHQAEKIFPAGSLIDLAIAAYIEDQWKKTPEVVDEKMLLIFLVCVAPVLLVIYVVLIGAFET